ncbi:MAG: ribonucleotide-diphosphate reductase subunit beta [Candidatus Dormibacteria bacterium]
MSNQRTVELVERSDLSELGALDIDDVYVHIDTLLQELPGPLDLYQRWERQQWSAHSIDFAVDRQHWNALGPYLQEQLEMIFSGFFVGEQAVTDTLSPILIGAPGEEDRWFLSTQVVDEARHAYFFARFFSEVVHEGDGLRQVMTRAWQWTASDAYDQIFGPAGALVGSTDAVRLDPTDTGNWVRAVTTYHLMVEGILALVGQRLVLSLLRRLDLMPAFRAGFTAVTRDESRHVNYGIWALRRAVRDGFEAEIRAVVDETLRPSLRVYVNPQRLVVIPADLPESARIDPRTNWTFAVDSVTKRLRAAGVDGGYIEATRSSAWTHIHEAVAEYEDIHGQDHPVREFQPAF